VTSGGLPCSGVLVVDDNVDLLKTLVDVLTDEGYVVQTACDGHEALAILQSAALPPCMILLDLTMPGMNGEEFRSKQLGDPRLAPIPVVGFTADPTNQSRLRAMKVDAIVSKPVSLDKLLAVIERYCDHPVR
jgi:two-component system chemotaxis response regulator CheY